MTRFALALAALLLIGNAHAQLPVPVPLANISVVPSTGTGVAQTFTFTFTGAGLTAYMLFRPPTLWPEIGWGGPGACLIYYDSGKNAFALVNDAGNALLPFPANSGNQQCAISGTPTAAVSGPTLTVTLPLAFTQAFVGTQTIWMIAQDISGSWGIWQPMGTYTVAKLNTICVTTAMTLYIDPTVTSGQRCPGYNFTFTPCFYGAVNAAAGTPRVPVSFQLPRPWQGPYLQ